MKVNKEISQTKPNTTKEHKKKYERIIKSIKYISSQKYKLLFYFYIQLRQQKNNYFQFFIVCCLSFIINTHM